MDAVELLTRQHRALEAALDAAAALEDAAEREAAVKHIGDELGQHLQSEEEIFYPAVRARRTEDILLESLEEHLSLKRLLADLLQLPGSDATFPPKFKVLKEQTEHHHKEEEEHLFPQVTQLLSAAERNDLGLQMQALQQRLRATGEAAETIAGQTDAAAPLT